MMTNPFDTTNPPSVPQPPTPTAAQQQQQKPAGDQSLAGMNSQQQLQAAWKGLGWDPNKANDYRGQQQQLVDYMSQHGGGNWATGDFKKADDWMQDPSGKSWDIITSGGQFVQNPDDTGAGGGGGYNYGIGNYTPWAPNDRNTGLWNQLMDRAHQSLNVNPRDPIIANQTNAFAATQQRGLRDYMSGLAEKQGPNANLSMEQRMGSQQASQATGQLQSQLMQNELNARRQEIQNALGQMGGQLSTDQQLALQKELAYLSNDQFLRSLGLQSEVAANSLDQQNLYG